MSVLSWLDICVNKTYGTIPCRFYLIKVFFFQLMHLVYTIECSLKSKEGIRARYWLDICVNKTYGTIPCRFDSAKTPGKLIKHNAFTLLYKCS